MAKMHWLEKLAVNSKLDYGFHKFFGFYKYLKGVKLLEPAKILEIGSGVGITSNFISSKFNKSTLIATDFDASQIESAKSQKRNANIIFKQEDATQLSFPQENFDACFAILVFHHINNFSDALREIHRVLKTGGKLFVYDIPWKSWNPLSRWFVFGQPGLFTKHEFIKILELSGFEIVTVKSGFNFWIEAKK